MKQHLSNLSKGRGGGNTTSSYKKSIAKNQPVMIYSFYYYYAPLFIIMHPLSPKCEVLTIKHVFSYITTHPCEIKFKFRGI